MKSLCRIVLIILFVTTMSINSQAFKNEPIESFKGVKWGSKLTRDFHFLKSDPTYLTEYYSRKGDFRSYLGVSAESVLYVFDFEIFQQALVSFNTRKSVKAIQHALEEKYGKGQVVKNKSINGNYIRWNGKDILIEFSSDRPDYAYLFFTSRRARAKVKKSLDAIDAVLDKSKGKKKSPWDQMKFK